MLSLGSDLKNARSALVLLHGRGASAEDMTGLAQEFALPEGMIVLAPQASGSIWYPQRLIAPVAMNEPHLSSAIRRIDETVEMLAQSGLPSEKVIIGGFSQGASLAIEFVLRSDRQWGGLLAFSGGYIWPMDVPRTFSGSLRGTPAFVGCSDVDPYIPLQRVQETVSALESLGALVNNKIYPGMGHTINQDEIDQGQKIIEGLK